MATLPSFIARVDGSTSILLVTPLGGDVRDFLAALELKFGRPVNAFLPDGTTLVDLESAEHLQALRDSKNAATAIIVKDAIVKAATTGAGAGAVTKRNAELAELHDSGPASKIPKSGPGDSKSQGKYAQMFQNFRASLDPTLILNVEGTAFGRPSDGYFDLSILQDPAINSEETLMIALMEITLQGIGAAKTDADLARRFPASGLYVRNTTGVVVNQMDKKRPDFTVTTAPERESPMLQRVTHVELKWQDNIADETVSPIGFQEVLGQPMTYAALMMDHQPWREFCITAIANFEGWRAIRVVRGEHGYSATYGPYQLYSQTRGFPLQALFFADPVALGYIVFGDLPTPWKVGKSLGAGASSAVYELCRCEPADAPVLRSGPTLVYKPMHAIKFVLMSVITNEREMHGRAWRIESARALLDEDRPRICEMIRPDGLGDWLDAHPCVIVLDRIVTALPRNAALSDLHREQGEKTLAALHAGIEGTAGIVHRDVRPENLGTFRFPGGAVDLQLLDFGFSVLPGRVPYRGSLSFESPEILLALVTGATDVDVSGTDDMHSFAKVVHALRQAAVAGDLTMISHLSSLREAFSAKGLMAWAFAVSFVWGSPPPPL
eukprot:c20636_g1_i3.p1 GENE.c20636_g1_i3~~c20636_g1_i3.p1  ORF type:complete len:609 (-),score=73.43 c20636_g1_i3:11-1837(-)